MHKSALVILLFALLAISDAYKYIASIETDVQSGQIYVGENRDSSSILYELDNVQVTQNAVHRLSTTQTLSSGSLFDRKRGNKRQLYASLEGSDDSLVYYKVPIGNANTLSAQAQAPIASLGLSLPPVYDTTDSIGIFPTSRNLTLVNINNLAVLDSFRYYGNRVFGRNVVYNHNNNHVISFTTYVPINAPYGLSVDEWDVSSGKFVSVKSTYDCQCNGQADPTKSPFYHVEFVENSCQVDYTVTPAQIWCVDATDSKLFQFQANNLAVFKVHKIDAKFDNVAFDFATQRGYAIRDTAPGYTVSKVNLSNGNVIGTFTDSVPQIDYTTFKLDTNEPHLYIAVISEDDASPTQIAWVNTNNLNGHGTVTLNTNGLN